MSIIILFPVINLKKKQLKQNKKNMHSDSLLQSYNGSCIYATVWFWYIGLPSHVQTDDNGCFVQSCFIVISAELSLHCSYFKAI
jgi:hypothetical protein